MGRSAAVGLRRSPTVLLRRRRLLLLRIRRVRRRRTTLLRVGRVRWLAALLGVRRVRRCGSATAVSLRRPLRRTLRHERVALLPRRRLALAGRCVALLRWRVAVAGLRRRRTVAIALRRRTVTPWRAIAIPGRPARRKHLSLIHI